MLRIEGLSKSFGGLSAVSEVDLNVEKGQIFGLIGPNGAGKTTLFNLIAGVYQPDKGRIIFNDIDITKLKPYEVSQKGIARTFQIVKPFGGMTVAENVMVGAFYHYKDPVDARRRALELISFVGLSSRKDILTKNLPIGERKKLEIARALSIEPQMILLDETMSGLNPKETEEVMGLIQKVREEGKTILVIEHNVRAITVLSDQIAILHHGEKIAEGKPQIILQDEKVIKAYLGEDYIHAANQ